MGLPMQIDFFTKDLSLYFESEEHFFTMFDIDISKNKDTILRLLNSKEDGMPYPIVISIHWLSGGYKNYIIEFDKDNSIEVDIQGELSLIEGVYNPQKLYQISIISSSEFSGDYLSVSDDPYQEKLTILSVSQPSAQAISYQWWYECCPSTNNAIIQIAAYHTASGETSVGYLKSSRTECDDSGCRIDQTLYYPIQGEVFHRPAPYNASIHRPGCRTYYNSQGPVSCLETYIITSHDYGSNLQVHRWHNMYDLINNLSSGNPPTAEQISGPGAPDYWTLYFIQ